MNTNFINGETLKTVYIKISTFLQLCTVLAGPSKTPHLQATKSYLSQTITITKCGRIIQVLNKWHFNRNHNIRNIL